MLFKLISIKFIIYSSPTNSSTSDHTTGPLYTYMLPKPTIEVYQLFLIYVIGRVKQKGTVQVNIWFI